MTLIKAVNKIKNLREHRVLIASFVVFSFITLPFLSTLPYLDGNIDFVQTVNYFNGGLSEYFNNWTSVHPPLKLIISQLSYSIFGITPTSYSLPGFIFGILGICAIYLITKELYGKRSANISALLFSFYPLFISTAIFMMRDFLLTVFIIISLLFYLRRRLILYSIFCIMAVLTKESGLLLPFCVLVTELLFFIKNDKLKQRFVNLFFVSLPFVSYLIWRLILEINNKNSWGDWIFASTASKGAIYTIINNILTLNFLNKFAFEHWEQFIFLNFNWIYILIIVFGIAYITRNRSVVLNLKENESKFYFASFLFFISYFFTVLTLQTYTIPRYALPLVPFLIIGVSKEIFLFKQSVFKGFLILLIFSCGLISLFSSIDPIATSLWGKTKILDQEVYALNKNLAGNDGITYNFQYLLIAEKRSDKIISANKQNKILISQECQWIFADPNNDTKMIKFFNLNTQLTCKEKN